MKKNCWLLLLLVCGGVSAQVGVNTALPLKPFHVDGKKDNPPSGALNSEQESNDVVVDKDGNVGIGTTSPKVKLDVRGDMAIEKKFKLVDGIKNLGVNGVFPLYIDKDGNIGRLKPKDPKPLIVLNSFDVRNNTTANYNSFNAGTRVRIPFKNEDIVLKKGDIAEITGDYLKIKQDGYYSLSSDVTFLVNNNANSAIDFFLLGDISFSRDSGATWTSIIAVRPIFEIPSTKNEQMSIQIIIPAIVSQLKANDLVRISYARAGEGGKITSIYPANDPNINTKGFQLSIFKL